MIIQKVKLAPFGAVVNREYEFIKGLNVMLGPNEAGKSTLVNAIFAAFFIPADVKRSSEDWKGFIKNCLPYPDGDTARVEIEYVLPGGAIRRYSSSWGEERMQRLVLDDGSEMNDPVKIREYLDRDLRLNRGTYQGVLFTRQEEMNRTLELLKENSSVTASIADLLRTALFQADGVSLERLDEKIEQEYSRLLSNWDLSGDEPRGRRGIENPHKTRVGAVLETYYRGEKLQKQLRQIRADEARIAEINSKLELSSKKFQQLADRIMAMEKLEGDLRRRGELEPELQVVKAQEEALKKVVTEWPKVEERVENLAKDIAKRVAQGETLEKELQQAAKVLVAREKRELLHRVRPLREDIEKKEAEIAALPGFLKADLDYLEQQGRKQDELRAVAEAMKLKASFKVHKPLSVKVTAGLEKMEEVFVESGTVLEGAGRLLLESAEWVIDIQSGQRNVEELIKEANQASDNHAAKLAEFELGHIEEARSIIARRSDLEGQIKNSRIRLEEQLGDLDYGELEATVLALGEDRVVRDPREIKSELTQTEIDINSGRFKLEQEEEKLKSWQKEFESLDQAFDQMADLRQKRNEKQQELEKLAPLPVEYETGSHFFEVLKELRSGREDLREQSIRLKEGLNEIQSRMPEESTEDLETELAIVEEELENLKRKGRAVHLVKEEFETLKRELDSDTYAPLVEKFTRYLDLATNSRYQVAALDGPLPDGITSTEGKTLPMELLSAGTTSGVALAIRMAIAAYLLEDAEGFLVMDDPMVHLDPERRESAAALIREFALKKQTIIATCDPVTAELLGGNLVRI